MIARYCQIVVSAINSMWRRPKHQIHSTRWDNDGLETPWKNEKNTFWINPLLTGICSDVLWEELNISEIWPQALKILFRKFWSDHRTKKVFGVDWYIFVLPTSHSLRPPFPVFAKNTHEDTRTRPVPLNKSPLSHYIFYIFLFFHRENLQFSRKIVNGYASKKSANFCIRTAGI